jgi:hypothetical protein
VLREWHGIHVLTVHDVCCRRQQFEKTVKWEVYKKRLVQDIVTRKRMGG